MKDGWGIFFSFAYVLLILSFSRRMESGGKLSPFVVRKLTHLFVGSWILPTFFLFRHWFMAILPPFCFIWMNLYLERKRFFSFETREGGYGTVYFPISFVLLLTLFWEEPLRVCALLGGLTMAWGDSLAALVGTRWGRHRYSVGRTHKSLEGSLAMWGGSFLASFVAFSLFHPDSFSTIALQSGLLALVATCLESFATRGIDNLTVPLGSAWIGYLFVTRF